MKLKRTLTAIWNYIENIWMTQKANSLRASKAIFKKKRKVRKSMNRRIIVSVLIKYKDKYLFIKQNKKDGAYQDCLHIVGGGLEDNETLEEAIKREAMEEVHVKLRKVIPFDFDSDVIMYKGEMTQLIFLRFTSEIDEFTGYADSDAKEIIWLSKNEILNYKHNEPSIRFLKRLGIIE